MDVLASLTSAAKRVSMRPPSRRQSSAYATHEPASANKRMSTASTGTSTTSGSEMFAVPSSPLAILLAGGRAVRMEGFLKEKGTMGFGWRTKFVCLEEGRIRISKNEEEDEDVSFNSSGPNSAPSKSTSESINLVDVESLRYSKRGSNQFGLVTATRSIKLKAQSGEEAEAWVQHILQEMKNQAQLLSKCAALLIKNEQHKGVEMLLRQTVRMWTLANGEMHETVADALQALGEYLVSVDREADGKVQLKRAEIIRDGLASGPKSLRPTRANAHMSKKRSSNAGLEELQIWLELQSKAEEGADVLARTEQLRKREKELMEIMSSQHESKVEELRNKAIQAEERARQAEAELQRLRNEQSRQAAAAAESEALGEQPKKENVLKRLSKRISQRLSRRSTLGSEDGKRGSDSESSATPVAPPRERKQSMLASTKKSSRTASMALAAPVSMPEQPESEATMEEKPQQRPSLPPRRKGSKSSQVEEQVEAEEDGSDEDELTEEEKKALLKAQRKAMRQKLRERRAERAQNSLDGSLQRTQGRKKRGACYLVHSETSEGTLMVQWSYFPVEGAIGQFIPSDACKIPKFKFVHNEGRSELIRGFQGPGGLKKYFQGIVQFLKMAFDHGSSQVVLVGGPIPVSVFLWKDEIVQRVTIGSAFSIAGTSAVTVFGEKNESYQGIVKMQLQQFCVVGCKAGHSMQLDSK